MLIERGGLEVAEVGNSGEVMDLMDQGNEDSQKNSQ